MKKENTIMKKVLAMLMAALMVAAMFTGCSSSKPATETTAAAAATAAAASICRYMNCDSVIHGRISVYIRIDACIAFANCRQISVAINFDHIGIAGAPTDAAITRITAIEVRTCPVPLPHGQRIPLRCLADRKISGCRFAILLAAAPPAIQAIITIAGAR